MENNIRCIHELLKESGICQGGIPGFKPGEAGAEASQHIFHIWYNLSDAARSNSMAVRRQQKPIFQVVCV